MVLCGRDMTPRTADHLHLVAGISVIAGKQGALQKGLGLKNLSQRVLWLDDSHMRGRGFGVQWILGHSKTEKTMSGFQFDSVPNQKGAWPKIAFLWSHHPEDASMMKTPPQAFGFGCHHLILHTFSQLSINVG